MAFPTVMLLPSGTSVFRALVAVLALAVGGAWAQAPATPDGVAGEILARARTSASAARLRDALQAGSELVPTGGGRGYALVWRPPVAPTGWIVTLHGSGGWAHDEIELWRPHAETRALGIVALQWWSGVGAGPGDYRPPHEVRGELQPVLAAVGARPENTLLHGFSRGSANLYALVALDARESERLFRHVVANAGGASPDFPQNRAIETGIHGPRPFAGTRWWMWCGGLDANVQRDGCPAMRRAQAWVNRLGGRAELREDETAGHGGFHRRPRNVEAALAWFARRD